MRGEVAGKVHGKESLRLSHQKENGALFVFSLLSFYFWHVMGTFSLSAFFSPLGKKWFLISSGWFFCPVEVGPVAVNRRRTVHRSMPTQHFSQLKSAMHAPHHNWWWSKSIIVDHRQCIAASHAVSQIIIKAGNCPMKIENDLRLSPPPFHSKISRNTSPQND